MQRSKKKCPGCRWVMNHVLGSYYNDTKRWRVLGNGSKPEIFCISSHKKNHTQQKIRPAGKILGLTSAWLSDLMIKCLPSLMKFGKPSGALFAAWIFLFCSSKRFSSYLLLFFPLAEAGRATDMPAATKENITNPLRPWASSKCSNLMHPSSSFQSLSIQNTLS